MILSEKKRDHASTREEFGRIKLSLFSYSSAIAMIIIINTTMQEQGSQSIQIIVEHMEEYLYNWCLFEYLQMKEYLQNTTCRLVITNAQSIYNYKGQHQQQNKKNILTLKTEFQSAGPGKCKLIPEKVTELLEKHQLVDPVCMLDMRGEKELSPSQHWSTLIFGGILGDHPPRDRPEPVRKHFTNIRHLGDLQLATDTAVLITRLIMHNKLNLSQIPLIREPTIRGTNSKGEKTTVQMEGFSYVSKQLDIQTGHLAEGMAQKQKKQIYMSQGVKNLLVEEDLSAQLLM